MNEFTASVIKIISSIPSGYVMTYGQIAAAAGNPKGARQVSRILHSMTEKYGLPWHRVLRKDGSIALSDHAGGYEQKDRLLHEGVAFIDDSHVDLNKANYTMH